MGVGRITGVLATAGALGVAGPAAWAGGAVCLVADPIWEAGHASAQGTMSAAVDTMASTFAEQSLLTHQALISAIRVHTRQTSLNAERDAVATTSNAEAAATSTSSSGRPSRCATRTRPTARRGRWWAGAS